MWYSGLETVPKLRSASKDALILKGCFGRVNADLTSFASIVDVDVEEEEEGAGDTRLLAEFIEKTGVPGRDLLSSRGPGEGDGEVANENARG